MVEHLVDSTESCVDGVVDHVSADVAKASDSLGTTSSGLISCLFLLKCFLCGISSLLLLYDLLDVHVMEFFFNLSLLGLELLGIGLSALPKTLLERVSLLLLLRFGRLQHLVIVVELALHEFSQLSTHLSFVLSAHSELVKNSLLLLFNLVLFLLVERVKSLLLQSFVLFLNVADLFTLNLVVRVLKHLIDLSLLCLLVLINEVL